MYVLEFKPVDLLTILQTKWDSKAFETKIFLQRLIVNVSVFESDILSFEITLDKNVGVEQEGALKYVREKINSKTEIETEVIIKVTKFKTLETLEIVAMMGMASKY
jgi:hypothetical protein